MLALFTAGLAFEARPTSHQIADDDIGGFFTDLGLTQLATPRFLARLYEALGYNSVADLGSIVEDDEYSELGISSQQAYTIARAAKLRLLERHLLSLSLTPLDHDAVELVATIAQVLYAEGYHDTTHLHELEWKEAQELGLSQDHWKIITGRTPPPSASPRDEL